jgi:hypothetical protein
MNEKTYLDNIAYKVQMYNDAKEEAIEWLISKKITDKPKIQNALIMSQIWLAHNIKDSITMADLMIYLGDDNMFDEQDEREIVLDQDMQGLNLQQILEASVI